MFKKIFSTLFSTRLMALLFVTFGVAMALGTFIENAHNTDTARKIIYNQWWFEAIMVFFVINFIGNIKRYQLLKKENWATLLLHLSFIFIIFGAFITRYISYEGMMSIREGETVNTFNSDKAFLTVMVDGMYQGEMKRKTLEKDLILATYCDDSNLCSNNFSLNDVFDNQKFSIRYKKYYFGAKQTLKENSEGKNYLKLVESSTGSRNEHYLVEGEVKLINNILFAYNKHTEGAVNLVVADSVALIQTPFEGSFMKMADQSNGKVEKDIPQTLNFRSLYNLGNIQFVLPELPKKGELVLESTQDLKAKNLEDALTVTITTPIETKDVTLMGGKGRMGIPQTIKIGNLDFTLLFGSKIYETPFKVKLNDFIANKYPGTEKSYLSYESKVTVIEPLKTFDYHIYMNNILDYKGYRLFQSSFDPDEKGTILSVNHDYWGTLLTYIGYFLLYAAMVGILFIKGSRFTSLSKKLNELNKKKAALSLLFFTFFSWSYAQHMPTEKEAFETISKYKISKEHAEKFGKLVIQDAGGRMKPINTFSSELLRKVSKNDAFEEMNADQVFLSMSIMPEYWYNIPLIYVKKENDSLHKILGVSLKEKHIALVDFFTKDGTYKLAKPLETAYRSAVPNQFEKDFIDVDKKVNLLYSALTGSILQLFPIPNDNNNKWVSYIDIQEKTGTELDVMKNALPLYINVLQKATQDGNYTDADKILDGMHNFQKKFGAKVLPSEDKINAEVLYNKYDVFKKIYKWYLYTGLLLLIIALFTLFYKNKFLNISAKVLHISILLLFILHTAGLVARWYVSGHAPWSDAYESMIYVAWATILFGLLFSKKSTLTLAATAFVTSIILMIAHWSWIDPAIANLQPVLNSYWLMIHVAVIVGSYGPFALAFVIGIISLFLITFTTKSNKHKLSLAIQELTIVNEMALTIGLVMLTIGNFLGGQWANESWGRYWGWDPKETWALISIMVYAFVIHMRLVPGLRSKWAYNFASVVAFASILMTYFGVNFYLTGLHSYASGNVETPVYFWYLGGFIVLLGLFSFIQFYKHYKK